MKSQTTLRLIQVDALRGIAALMVVFFHYTTKYEELFGHAGKPAVYVPWGYLGVNLFFMISGFVIFMTLDKTVRPLDFVVSRGFRLYPAYWFAVTVTFLITQWTDLHGQTVDLGTALINLSMVQGLFGIKNVDGVYWTLKIELIFYGWALLLFYLRSLDKIQGVLIGLLLLRCVEHFVPSASGYTIPSELSRLLLLDVIPWFAAGISIYKLSFNQSKNKKPSYVVVVILSALAIGLSDGLALTGLLVLFALLLFSAATGSISLLSHRIFTLLGTMSYCLYLLHENIGWSIIAACEKAGTSANTAILLALFVSLGLSFVAMRIVEQPAVAWGRAWYRLYRARRDDAVA
ncbi:acyltransferase family protein [Massilia litorea]|uniref:Acyltransferase n=1 Tax=Massilia litorea TaxID=2769491 RepID=A0A7L9U7U1_9BURK|nr:acyltransferase [Massilia litorea]QOL50927.1 acyltransferase [Massilia litorea]